MSKVNDSISRSKNKSGHISVADNQLRLKNKAIYYKNAGGKSGCNPVEKFNQLRFLIYLTLCFIQNRIKSVGKMIASS